MKMRIGVTSELYQITTKMKTSHVSRTRELGRNRRHIRLATELWYLAKDGTNGWTVLGFWAVWVLAVVGAALELQKGTTFLLEEDTARSSASKHDREGMDIFRRFVGET